MRLKNIDFLKGLLIILVVLGHILKGRLQDNLFRYFIYSFHMPIFIGITGYLFNYAKVSNLSANQLIQKYLFRVIVPWSIAIFVYTVILHLEQLSFVKDFKVILKAFVFPYYHLWFIPAFLGWIGLSYFFSKLKTPIKTVLLISLIISFISFVLKTYPVLYENLRIRKLIEIIQYTFRPFFYFFFSLGIYLRNKQVVKALPLTRLMLFIFSLGTLLLFFYQKHIISILLFFLFNIYLLYYLIEKVQTGVTRSAMVIEWIGINSFGIYLWHVIPIIWIRLVIGTNNLMLFYATTIGVEILFILLVYFMSKIYVVRKYLFGVP